MSLLAEWMRADPPSKIKSETEMRAVAVNSPGGEDKSQLQHMGQRALTAGPRLRWAPPPGRPHPPANPSPLRPGGSSQASPSPPHRRQH